jgi:hypothetical protein
MKVRNIFTAGFVVAAFLLIPLGIAIAADNDPRCEGLTGAAFGLCKAAIAVGCDDPEVTKPGCTKVEENFMQITGSEPPWTQPVCTDNSECADYEFCRTPDGSCGGPGVCKDRYESCLGAYEYVCGCNGTTYNNYCEAFLDGISMDYEGQCLP